MRPLLPTLKESKRYLAYEIRSAAPVTGKAFLDRLRGILGLFDSAAAGLQMVQHDSQTGKGVLRTSTEMAPRVRAAVLLVTEIGGTPARVRVLRSSGILNRVGGENNGARRATVPTRRAAPRSTHNPTSQ